MMMTEKPDRGLRRIVTAIAGALAMFCLVAATIYAKMAHAGTPGSIHGGPEMLAAAMAGLFGGGVAFVVALIVLLRRR
jgi:hypothetical protein